jgi:hypothetical protein
MPDDVSDYDIARPVATTYRMRIDYALDSDPGDIRTVQQSGPIVSRVPTMPQMTGMTITGNEQADGVIVMQRAHGQPVSFASCPTVNDISVPRWGLYPLA